MMTCSVNPHREVLLQNIQGIQKSGKYHFFCGGLKAGTSSESIAVDPRDPCAALREDILFTLSGSLSNQTPTVLIASIVRRDSDGRLGEIAILADVFSKGDGGAKEARLAGFMGEVRFVDMFKIVEGLRRNVGCLRAVFGQLHPEFNLNFDIPPELNIVLIKDREIASKRYSSELEFRRCEAGK